MIKKITPKEKSEQRTVSGKHVGVLTSIGAWGVFQGQQLLYVSEKKKLHLVLTPNMHLGTH